MNELVLADNAALPAATILLETGTLTADPNWKPEPCGHSREELRAILDEVMA